MKNNKFILIALLSGISAFCIFKYTLSLKEKYTLLNTLKQAKQQAVALENEKQNLLQALKEKEELQESLTRENSTLKLSLEISQSKIAGLDTDFKKEVEQLNSEITVLKNESVVLKEEKDKLNTRLNEAIQEKDNLAARLGSVVELKKAIRELKVQMRNMKEEIREKAVIGMSVMGNRGFVIKDGKPTYVSTARVKIAVEPALEE